jgi:hypothetical protein
MADGSLTGVRRPCAATSVDAPPCHPDISRLGDLPRKVPGPPDRGRAESLRVSRFDGEVCVDLRGSSSSPTPELTDLNPLWSWSPVTEAVPQSRRTSQDDEDKVSTCGR